MSKWVGYAVSVNCGETLGCYQGTIVEADGLTITLTKAFRNGFPYPKSQVTLNAADIKDLRIISARAAGGDGGGGRRARATVCESLQASHNSTTSSGNQTPSTNFNNDSSSVSGHPVCQAPQCSRPVDILSSRNKSHNNHAGSYGSGSTPKSRGNGFGGRGDAGPAAPHDKARRRNEACFGAAAEPALHDDFDFEGNLALFDKRALWASMRHSKPDLVRTTDECKYRHDENVLGGAAGAGGAGGAARCVVVPEALRGGMQYVTDEGVPVDSVSPALRRDLWEGMRRLGLEDTALALVARAAVDVALRLVGGGRRLEARNAHQAPRVVCVCGAHRGGAAALLAARVLASRGARPHVLLAEGAPLPPCAALQRELAALRLDGVPVATRAAELPDAPDLVLLALYDPLLDEAQEQYVAACAWAARCRAACVALEPAGGGWARVECRASVLGVAAVPLAPALGRVFLADAAPPQQLFAERRVRYRPPFGAAPALPLNRE